MDELAIAALLYRYARAVDTKDWELYRSVFTDDAYIDYSSAGAAAGSRDEVIDWLRQGFGVIPQQASARGKRMVRELACWRSGTTYVILPA
jgi:hypothetical protein